MPFQYKIIWISHLCVYILFNFLYIGLFVPIPCSYLNIYFVWRPIKIILLYHDPLVKFCPLRANPIMICDIHCLAETVKVVRINITPLVPKL